MPQTTNSNSKAVERKRLMQAAKLLSAVFSPFYAPILAFLWLFFFSYLQLYPLAYKIYILVSVFFYTILMPRLSIYLIRRVNKWTGWQASHRHHRHLPYIVTLFCYGCCLYSLISINAVMFFRGIILGSLAAQIICAVVNLRWKISTHMVGIGGLVGVILAFSHIFQYNPLWATCGLLLLSGMLGTSRMLLRQHTLAQVLVGFLVGLLCALVFLLFIWLI